MNGIVCGFSGRVGSGKTSVSEAVSRHFNWPRVSFGDYVRKIAQERGLDSSSRSVLQTLGESLFNNGVEEFCKAVINEVKWSYPRSLVIDGIRHQDVLYKLKEIVAPSHLVLVYIYVNEDHRLQRMVQRDGLNQNDVTAIDEHSTEKDTKVILSQIADIRINGEQSLDIMVREIANHLKCHLNCVRK